MSEFVKRAVVLLSGGLDSSTVLAIAKQEGFEVHALSFDYGQHHSIELEAARRVALDLGARQHVIAKIEVLKRWVVIFRLPTCRRGTLSFYHSPLRGQKF